MDMSRPPRPPHVFDRRRLIRHQVDIAADLSGSILPRRRKVIMKDINAFGCRIETAGRLNLRDFVMVSVPSFGPFGAFVVWQVEDQIGLEFRRPLDAAVVTHVTRLRTEITCPIELRWRSLVS
jgi:hypothetical protein